MTDFQEMMAAGDFLPQRLMPWIIWMQIVLFLCPVVSCAYAAARWMILAQVINAVIAYCVFVSEGNNVTRLFGLGHLVWVFPGWMFWRDVRSTHWVGYRAYAAVASVTILISLGFDVVDIGRWIAGERLSVLELPAE